MFAESYESANHPTPSRPDTYFISINLPSGHTLHPEAFSSEANSCCLLLHKPSSGSLPSVRGQTGASERPERVWRWIFAALYGYGLALVAQRTALAARDCRATRAGRRIRCMSNGSSY